MNLPTTKKLNDIRKSIEKALADVAKEHDIDSFSIGKISYDDSGFRTKIEALFQGGDTPQMKNLKQSANYIGFKPEIANATILYGNREFKVTGMERTKFNLTGVDGKKYKANIDDVLKVLQLQNSDLIIDKLPNSIKKSI